MIENLNFIKENGMDAFIAQEKERWTCAACGGMVCVHRGYCSECGMVKFIHKGTNRAPIK
jgi:ribosomal protein S27AE